jgi:hypothetical protein
MEGNSKGDIGEAMQNMNVGSHTSMTGPQL